MTRRGQQFGKALPGRKQTADYALVPLAIPSLAGPGAITVTIVSMSNLTGTLPWYTSLLLASVAIILTMLITYLMFLGSGVVIHVLGKKGMDAFTRVMGLLLQLRSRYSSLSLVLHHLSFILWQAYFCLSLALTFSNR